MSLHQLHFRAFCQATEDEEKVRTALLFASGAKQEAVERSRCDGYHGNPIVMLDVRLTSSRTIRSVFQRLSSSDRQAMLADLERRLDEECAFYFRLDKQQAYLGRMVMGEAEEGDDVIAVHGKVKAYPKDRGTALEVMRSFLSAMG